MDDYLKTHIGKVWNYECLSPILVCTRPFSFTWDRLKKRLRNMSTSRPLKNPTRLMWNYVERSCQRGLNFTIGEAGTSKKSKKTNEAAGTNNQIPPALQAEIEAELN